MHPLSIYVLWHPENTDGRFYARRIFDWFHLPHGLGLPVYYRSPPPPGQSSGRPSSIPFDEARLNLVVLLVDEHMVADGAWRDWLEKLVGERAARRAVFYPVALHRAAYNLPSALRQLNYISLDGAVGRSAETARTPREQRLQALLKQLTEAFCRVVLTVPPPGLSEDSPVATAGEMHEETPPPVKIFISHAKSDGVEYAKTIRDYIYSDTQLKAFYDENDIALGYKFQDVLERTLEENTAALIAVNSDLYASRPWCRRELQLFRKPTRDNDSGRVWKRHPVLVVDALQEQMSRSIPEMGSAPCVRWREHQEALYVDALLRQCLIRAYHLQLAYRIAGPNDARRSTKAVISWAPDPLSLFQLRKENGRDLEEVIYPGYGLSGLELDDLQSLFPSTRFLTFEEAGLR